MELQFLRGSDENREQYVRTRTVTPMVSNLRPHPALGDSGDSGYIYMPIYPGVLVYQEVCATSKKRMSCPALVRDTAKEIIRNNIINDR
jgi:hypothetical protein